MPNVKIVGGPLSSSIKAFVGDQELTSISKIEIETIEPCAFVIARITVLAEVDVEALARATEEPEPSGESEEN